MLLSAVLFDVDGTIAETEDFHRRSFNESFKEFNLDWFWDEAIYTELINIGDGKERIEYYIKRAWPEMLEYKNLTKYINSIHKVKNEIFKDYKKDIEERIKNNQTFEITIIDLKNPELLEVKVANKKAMITLKYESQQIHLVKNDKKLFL